MACKLEDTKCTLIDLKLKLECTICKKWPEDPQILWCQHTFCNKCIMILQSCPQCHFAITPNDVVPNIMLSKLLRVVRASAEIFKCFEENESSSQKDEKNQLNQSNSIKTIESNDCLSPKRLVKSKPWRTHKAQQQTPTSSGKTLSKVVNTKTKKESERDILKPTVQDIKTPKLASHSPCILFSAKKVKANKVNTKGETSLQIVCRQGNLSKVQSLLEDGAEPNVKDYANWTPLCDAISSGNIDVVRALLKAGARVNTPCHLNSTALFEAVLKKDKALVKLLVSYGADMHQRTSLNNTPFSIADEEMKALLMSCATVSIQPHPRISTIPKAVLVNRLPLDQVEIVMSFCKKFNLTLSTNFSEEITHVVVEKTRENTCHGSMEVMQAILHGCSVVGMDWVTASLQGKLLPVDNFEPLGTDDYPMTDVFQRARLNREQLLPRLFDGCHISLQHDQHWPPQHKQDVMTLVIAAGAQFQPRACDAERIPPSEQTIMFHAPTSSPFELVSHLVLYQPGPAEPLLKYNMAHIKSLPVSWFLECVKTFKIKL